MILTCPACSTSFNIDESLLGSRGRKVRCGKCAHQWHQTSGKSAESSEAPAKLDRASEDFSVPPVPPPQAKRVSNVKRPRRQGGFPWGWMFLLGVAIGILAGALLGRDMVIAKFPQMTRIYELVGFTMPLPGEGLTLENVNSLRRLEDSNRVLVVEGEVLNVTQATVKLPLMRASLYDGQGNELMFWHFTADGVDLGPGETAHFETSTMNPPSDGANLAISFTAESPESPESIETTGQDLQGGEASDQ